MKLTAAFLVLCVALLGHPGECCLPQFPAPRCGALVVALLVSWPQR